MKANSLGAFLTVCAALVSVGPAIAATAESLISAREKVTLEVRIRPAAYSPPGNAILRVDRNGEAEVEVDILNRSDSPVYFFPANLRVLARADEKAIRENPDLRDRLIPSGMRVFSDGYLWWPAEGEWSYSPSLIGVVSAEPTGPSFFSPKRRERWCALVPPSGFAGRRVRLRGLNDWPLDQVIAVYQPNKYDEYLSKRHDLAGLTIPARKPERRPAEIGMSVIPTPDAVLSSPIQLDRSAYGNP